MYTAASSWFRRHPLHPGPEQTRLVSILVEFAHVSMVFDLHVELDIDEHAILEQGWTVLRLWRTWGHVAAVSLSITQSR